MCWLTGELRENKKCFLTNNTTQDIIGIPMKIQVFLEKKKKIQSVSGACWKNSISWDEEDQGVRRKNGFHVKYCKGWPLVTKFDY